MRHQKVINIMLGSRVRYAWKFSEGGFTTVAGRDNKPSVEIEAVADPDDPEGCILLCCTALHREKEGAMLSGNKTCFFKQPHKDS